MKDSYGFHLTEECLSEYLQHNEKCLQNALDKLGLKYKYVTADSGAIGGDKSEEFHVLNIANTVKILLRHLILPIMQ